MDGASVADARGFVYEPVRGPKRKIEFEPGSASCFERVEAVWNGSQWRVTGQEVVPRCGVSGCRVNYFFETGKIPVQFVDELKRLLLSE